MSGYHRNWTNAPKDIQQLLNVYDVRKKGNPSLGVELAAFASHVVYDEHENLDLAEYFSDPRERKVIETILPRLSEMPGGMFDIADQLFSFVSSAKYNNNQKQVEDLFEELLEELLEEQEEKETKQKGNAPGKKGGELWRGDYGSMPLDTNLKEFPAVASMDIMQNSTSPVRELMPGKPKVESKRVYARSILDLRYAQSSDLSLPPSQFWLKYARNEIIIKKPMKRLSKKQKKIVFLDDSSSMGEQAKREWLKRIFSTILLDIVRGNSIMYFSPFLRTRNPLRKVETLEEVNAFCADFRKGTGGGTDLSEFLPELMAQISTGKVDGLDIDNRTEILIINDGQDYPGEFEPLLPIHCISVEETNMAVHELCNKSGGQYWVAQNGALLLQ